MPPTPKQAQRTTALLGVNQIRQLADHDPNVATRRTQVEEQNGDISNALDRLQRVTESLQSRLASVTGAYPACDDAKCSPPDPCLVPLADLLRSHHRRINAVASQIDALLANIEL